MYVNLNNVFNAKKLQTLILLSSRDAFIARHSVFCVSAKCHSSIEKLQKIKKILILSVKVFSTTLLIEDLKLVKNPNWLEAASVFD